MWRPLSSAVAVPLRAAAPTTYPRRCTSNQRCLQRCHPERAQRVEGSRATCEADPSTRLRLARDDTHALKPSLDVAPTTYTRRLHIKLAVIAALSSLDSPAARSG